MTRSRVWIVVVMAVACLVSLPSIALAQSTVGGTVKDTSGGVLPGVTVDVSGTSIIEGTKSAVTDGGGGYRVTDLRPGMYTVKFSLVGFATIERAAFQLLSDFNARIDAEMKVGTLEETITVTGAAPIVDVQSAVKVAVLDREALDNIPTGGSIFGIGQLILGVTLSTPDVGGSASAMSQYMSLRGGSVGSANNTVMVDGMVINGLQSNGAVQTYINDADFQEMTYQTAGAGADRSGGGVTLNMIPKEGGNRLSGDASSAYRPGELQGDNYSERFKLWGLPVDKNGNPAINRIVKIYDLTGSGGGPIQRDRLWFFISGRAMSPVNTVPNTFLDDGSQGIDDNYIRQSALRLTYQLSPQHKFGAFYERVFKWRGHDMSAFEDPETVASQWTSPNYSTAAAKYTGTLSSRLLVEGGYSQNVEFYRNPTQPGISKARPLAVDLSCQTASPWCSTIAATGTGGGASVAPTNTSNMSYPVSQVLQGSASFVTSSHRVKAGVSWKYGFYGHGADANGDLSQGYPTFNRLPGNNYNVFFPTTTLSAAERLPYFPTLYTATNPNGPCNPGTGVSTCTVTLRNTPRLSQETLNYDLGFFVQDSFTLKRLTLSAGLRYEMVKAQVDEFTAPAGRFVPERTSPERKDMPDWSDWAPRFQAVFDVFGDSKTAFKYSFNRYNEAQTVGIAQTFNGIVAATSTRTWTDLNNDNIAQGQRTWNAAGTSYTDCVYLTAGCEINLTGITGGQAALASDFGLVGIAGTYGGFERPYRLEQGVELQHALLPRMSLSGSWFHGWNKNRTKTVNLQRTDDGTLGTQYTRENLFNPLDGTPFLYYNQFTTAFAGANNVTYLEPLTDSQYDSYTFDTQLRPYAGAQVGGGISLERTMTNDCLTSLKRADGSAALVDPNTLKFCDDANLRQYAGGPVLAKAYLKNFKLSGAFPVVYGINFGFSYQNLDGGGGLVPTMLAGASFRYPTGLVNNMLGNSTPVPACPTAFGCVPDGVTSANLSGGGAGTSSGALYPGSYIKSERVVQLDIRASKNFRVGRFSVQPAIEAFNVMNIDQVRGRQSSQVGNAAGTYLQPNTMLQGRIVGFGANLKW